MFELGENISIIFIVARQYLLIRPTACYFGATTIRLYWHKV